MISIKYCEKKVVFEDHEFHIRDCPLCGSNIGATFRMSNAQNVASLYCDNCNCGVAYGGPKIVVDSVETVGALCSMWNGSGKNG